MRIFSVENADSATSNAEHTADQGVICGLRCKLPAPLWRQIALLRRRAAVVTRANRRFHQIGNRLFRALANAGEQHPGYRSPGVGLRKLVHNPFYNVVRTAAAKQLRSVEQFFGKHLSSRDRYAVVELLLHVRALIPRFLRRAAKRPNAHCSKTGAGKRSV